MKKSDLKFMASLIEQANPLKLVKDDGTSYVFYSKTDAYHRVLSKVYSYSAVTLCDVVFVISKLYNLKQFAANSIYTRYLSSLGIKPFEPLDPQVSKNANFYRKFIRGLSTYCQTEFDIYQFDRAFQNFLSTLERAKLNTNIKSTKEIEDEQKQ